ncbi:MAG TPA: PAS domain S-box protein [Bacteroidota bacterium]|nr:PAS domain S-box protein [Bacteroidota bacterium]
MDITAETAALSLLLIEDDADSAQLTSATIMADQRHTWSITIAGTLAEGLAALSASRFDAVLMDLNLPDSRGLDSFLTVAAQASNVPVIIQSAVHDEAIALEAVRTGAQDYLLKDSASRGHLLRSLLYAVERFRLLQELEAARGEVERREREALRVQEQLRLERDLFTSGPVLVMRRPPEEDRPLLYISPNIARYGYQPADFLSGKRSFISLVHEDDRDRIRERLSGATPTVGAVLEQEYRIRDARGEIVWLYEVTRSIRDEENGTVLQTYAVDVSAKRRVEEKLLRTEHRFSTVLEGIKEIVFETDGQGTLRYISDAVLAILEYDAAELQGTAFARLIIEEQQEEWRDMLRSMVDGQREQREFVLRGRNGTLHSTLVTCRASCKGCPADGMAGVITDLTTQRTMQGLLHVAQQQIQQYLDIAEVLFLSLDRDGRITLVNNKACDLLGYSEYELNGRDWYTTCLPEGERVRMREYLDGVVGGTLALPAAVETAVRCRSGALRSIRWHFAPMYDSRGELLGSVGSGEDITERRRIEAEIRDSREMLDLALWGADLGAWEWRPADDSVTLNARARGMLGYTESDVPSFTRLRIETLPEEDVRRLHDMLQEHVQGGTPFHQAETWMISRDGEWRWVLERGKVVERDTAGYPLRVVGTLLDLTERKYAEIAIEDSEKKFRLLAENSSDIIWTCDPAWNLTFVSPSVEYLLGYAPAALLGGSIRVMFDPEGLEQTLEQFHSHVEALQQGLTTERSSRFELRARTGGGDHLWVEVVATPILDRMGKLVAIHGNTRDIHRRKLAQIALADSEEKYRLLVENQTDLLVKIDLDGRILFASPSYCRMFGKSEEELLGGVFFPHVHEEDRGATLDAMKSLMIPPHVAHVEQRALTTEGWRWFAWSDTAVLDEEGEITSIIGVGRDITERKMAERALIDSEKRLRTVISNLPVILFSLDAKGVFTLSEGRGLDTLGLKSGQVVGRGVYDVYADYPVILESIERSMQGESHAAIVEIDGKHFETWYSPLTDTHGQVNQVIGVAVDITDRVRTQRELARHRDHLEELVEARTLELERVNERLRRFRFALDSAADNIYIIDPATLTFVDVNESAAVTLGYEREELLTMDLAELLPEQGKQPLIDLIAAIREHSLEVGDFETHFRHKDGRRIPVEVLMRQFFSEGVELLIATVRDITRRLAAERALKESEGKYRNVLENASEGIVVVQDLRIKFFNDAALSFTGLATDVLLELNMLEFIHPDDHHIVRKQYAGRLAGERLPESYDVRMFDSNGTIKWMEVRDVAISWEGRPATLNFFNDITARKHAEDYIHFQASLLDIVRNAVIALDIGTRIVYWNAFAQELYGIPNELAIGSKIADVVPMGDFFVAQVLPILRKKGFWEGETDVPRVDGNSLPVLSRWNTIVQNGTITGFVGIGIDLTEMKKLQRDLLQSQKLASLGILSEGIAHELRNPLGYASSAAQLLLNKRDLTQEQLDKYGKVIYSGVDKANKIIENLLLIGKPKGQLMKVEVDLADIIAEAKGMLSSHPLAVDLQLDSSVVPGEAVVFGNREMLVQLLYNLFTNALNAMGGHGNIRVRAERDEDSVGLRISDTGPGIPEDIAGNVFDPFFTASKSDKGIGLGLTLCYFIMDDHDGSIALMQPSPDSDEGAIFRLAFPKR